MGCRFWAGREDSPLIRRGAGAGRGSAAPRRPWPGPGAAGPAGGGGAAIAARGAATRGREAPPGPARPERARSCKRPLPAGRSPRSLTRCHFPRRASMAAQGEPQVQFKVSERLPAWLWGLFALHWKSSTRDSRVSTYLMGSVSKCWSFLSGAIYCSVGCNTHTKNLLTVPMYSICSLV